MNKENKEEPTLTNITINDIIQVYCDNERDYVDAKVLQIKERDEKTNIELKERQYYIHFLNFEKRMDKWIPQSIINKNFGKSQNGIIDGTNIINHSLFKESVVLTRKRSSLFNEAYVEKESLDTTVKVKNVESIVIGYYEIDTWYYSPFPEEFTSNKKLYICEHCLKYMKKRITLLKHIKTCEYKVPPGKKVYHQTLPIDNANANTNMKRIPTSVSVYEIQGDECKLFCQNLCLIAKLFLDHKSIYYDVSPFKFYVLAENDANGSHIAAYFSKEVNQATEFNLACIMVLPPYQRKGYGQFLISMSYYLSNREHRICTPETPLSDLGRISYKSYWTISILETLLKHKGNLCIEDISKQTGIKIEDVTYTLNELSLIKYWKGQQVIQNINIKQIEEFLNKKKASKKNHTKFNSLCITDKE